MSMSSATAVGLPEKIRVSVGSAMVLGLIKGRIDANPTTAYLLTYRKEKCTANCGFCPQARRSKGRADMLSRVTWPVFQTKKVIPRIEEAVRERKIRRVCIQALNYPTVFQDLLAIAKSIQTRVKVPISVSCQPLNLEKLEKLAENGVERVGIPLDAATKQIFERVKGVLAGGPYMWERQIQALKEAVKVFGRGRVTTHLIVGLGETEREMVQTLQWCVDNGIYPGMFAFTPIPGTALEKLSQPPVGKYRRIQVAHHLITNGLARYENMKFDENEKLVDFGVSDDVLKRVTHSGKPFLTSGCPNCNRPYYNESPGGPLYNYPRPPSRREIEEIEDQLLTD